MQVKTSLNFQIKNNIRKKKLKMTSTAVSQTPDRRVGEQRGEDTLRVHLKRRNGIN